LVNSARAISTSATEAIPAIVAAIRIDCTDCGFTCSIRGTTGHSLSRGTVISARQLILCTVTAVQTRCVGARAFARSVLAILTEESIYALTLVPTIDSVRADTTIETGVARAGVISDRYFTELTFPTGRTHTAYARRLFDACPSIGARVRFAWIINNFSFTKFSGVAFEAIARSCPIAIVDAGSTIKAFLL